MEIYPVFSGVLKMASIQIQCSSAFRTIHISRLEPKATNDTKRKKNNSVWKKGNKNNNNNRRSTSQITDKGENELFFIQNVDGGAHTVNSD